MGEKDEVKEDVYGCEITKWLFLQDKQSTRPQLEPRAETPANEEGGKMLRNGRITGLKRR